MIENAEEMKKDLYCLLWTYLLSKSLTEIAEYSSGTSIHLKNRIHHIGDRKMKTLLTLASVSAIQCDQELKQYYKKKIAEGVAAVYALTSIFTKEENKPATKKDIQNLANKLQRYRRIII